jgi:hypothetical protein
MNEDVSQRSQKAAKSLGSSWENVHPFKEMRGSLGFKEDFATEGTFPTSEQINSGKSLVNLGRNPKV